MTAEVVLMNKQAVALAADSAVTIMGSKIFNSANKLFNLAPGYPIGILIYNNAELMGIPWEIIIKFYREYILESKTRFTSLQEYGDHFIQFLDKRKETLFNEAQQETFVRQLMQGLMQNDIRATVRKKLEEIILQTAARVSDDDVVQITKAVIEGLCNSWQESPDLFPTLNTVEIEEKFQECYGDIFEEIFNNFLSNLPISKTDKARLKRMCAQWSYKERWFLSIFSGVVFAGYGENELFPTCIAYQFEGMMCNQLKYKALPGVSISFDKIHAGFLPFAQDDVMRNVLGGIHPQYLQALLSSLENMFIQIHPERIVDSISGLSVSDKSRLLPILTDINTRALQEVFDKVNRIVATDITDPIMQILTVLPKDELASMAETLVSITSFMRRVSNSRETVGGPIDVAVISKKDGFIWIKRKHYFDSEHNYEFL
ncbi:MAG: hypothetical protein H0X30_05545 [Anaerolineae bacterium]|nr:hypothetical protein [Anaerolineae bacterium]